MQYLLTKEEYDNLAEAGEREKKRLRETIQDLCTKVADNMPIEWGWGRPEPKPWGCILSTKSEWYCDQCPVEKDCPCTRKEWSK